MPRELNGILRDLELRSIRVTGRPSGVGGGNISRTLRVDSNRGPLLLKIESADRSGMLAAEQDALDALRAAGAVAVPEVLAEGVAGRAAYLAIEWIEFGAKTAAAEHALGVGLARLHRATADTFGWHRDNFIGPTPQLNGRGHDWTAFWRDMRLAPQLDRARRNGLPSDALKLGARLMEDLDTLLAGHAPPASLLHGDLWGGNWSATPGGVPYLYDPASYYGDRETDLAMTRLFGGFGAAFYRAYQEEWPLPPGADRRVDLYNLYHVLNHFNLFGGGYAGQAMALLRRLTTGRGGRRV